MFKLILVACIFAGALFLSMVFLPSVATHSIGRLVGINITWGFVFALGLSLCSLKLIRAGR